MASRTQPAASFTSVNGINSVETLQKLGEMNSSGLIVSSLRFSAMASDRSRSQAERTVSSSS